ncbi:MAG TPA: prepilin peptidase [Abditibacteriaceae bacterium]|jgi:prepilin signal peptidase PulO-like enzyme (type II secretory pathway)
MLLLILFVLGTCVGSFLNVCIWRLPRGESVVEPPSHCPRCDTRLQALDLVPLWSQVFLKARCRYCGNTISWRYFGIEFLTGVLFVLAGWRPGNLTGDSWWSAAWTGDAVYLLQLLVVMSCLVVIFWIDYETFLIPLSAALIIGLAGVAGDAWRVTQGMASLTDGTIIEGYALLPAPLPASVVAMVVTATLLWLLRELFSWIYGKEAMGFGDVFLVAGIAANIGWSALLGTFFFLSVMLGALIGVTLRIPRAVRAYRWATARAARTTITAATATLPPTPESNVIDATITDETVAAEETSEPGLGVTDSDADVEEPQISTSPQTSTRDWSRSQSLAWPLARHAFRKSVPFGPMLAVGAIVTLLYGAQLNESYLNWVNGIGQAAPTQARREVERPRHLRQGKEAG